MWSIDSGRTLKGKYTSIKNLDENNNPIYLPNSFQMKVHLGHC